MLAGPNDHRMTDFSLAAEGELDGGLTDDLAARVKGELEPGERLLWAGRSDPPIEPIVRGVLRFAA